MTSVHLSKPDVLPPLLRISRSKIPLWKRVLYFVGAGLAFVAGIFGWLVPVVTGIPFYIVALILLAKAGNGTAECLNWAEAKLSLQRRRQLRAAIKKIPIRRLRESLGQD